MTRLSLTLALLGASGCKNLPIDTSTPTAELQLVAPGDATGARARSAIGPAPASTWVVAVDADGAPVAADSVDVDVGGTAVTVELDSYGYGAVELAAPGSAEIGGVVEPASLHAVGVAWPGLAMMRAVPGAGTASHAVGLTGGALVAGETTAWWVDAGVPLQVLDLPEGIAGVLADDLDLDGALDAVVWSTERVVVLKGRPDGGVARAVDVVRDGYTVGGVAAGDPSGDGFRDLVIGYGATGGGDTAEDVGLPHEVVILEGDGGFGFVGTPYEVTDAPVSVAVGDNDGDGLEEISALLSTGVWVRLAADDGAYARTTPGTIELLPDGYTLVSGYDLNGDGADELFALGPYVPGSVRTLLAFDLDDGVTRIQLDLQEGRFTFGDANGDGRDDVWVVEGDGTLSVLAYTGGEYVIGATGITGLDGPPAVTDVDGDGWLDAVVAGSGGTWPWFGGREDDEGRWRPADPGVIGYAVDLAGPIAAIPGDGLQLVGFESQAEAVRLVAWRVDGSMVRIAEVDLSGTVGIDVEVCDGAAWALTDAGLSKVDLAAQAVTDVLPIADGTAVGCGEGPDGAVGALLAGGTVQLLASNLAPATELDATTAGDVAVGGGLVDTCLGAACGIAWWGEGGGFVAGDSATLELRLPDGVVTLDGAGHPTVADVDGDGFSDLIAVPADGEIVVHRATGQGYGPLEGFHTLTAFAGPVAVGDANNDGVPELVVADVDRLVLVGEP